MVKNYLEEEAIKGLNLFYKNLKFHLNKKKSNQAIYESFDEEICHIITEYLRKIGVLKEKT